MIPTQGETVVKIEELPASVLYAVARLRWRYGRDRLDTYIKQPWFMEPLYKHVTGRRPKWAWGQQIPEEDGRVLASCGEVMREFCAKSESEVENLLVSRSTLDAANYSVRVKGARLEDAAEREFLERCKGKKSRFNALMTYCGKWDIMPENMTEVTMVAGFEGGRRGRIGADFMKKLSDNKRRCKDLLSQIMKLEGIGEDEPIKKIMERLG